MILPEKDNKKNKRLTLDVDIFGEIAHHLDLERRKMLKSCCCGNKNSAFDFSVQFIHF